MGPLLLLVVVAVTAAAAPSELHHRQRRIAVIGGGISGTFVTKYLAEYDNNAIKNSCLIDEIVVFDVSLPPPGLFDSEDNNNSNVEFDENTYIPSSSSDPRPPNWQGSRVSSITLNDGNVVELGGSIIYNGNKLVGNMMDGDPTFLQRIPPMDGDSNDDDDNNDNSPRGFGIYHGNQTWLINTARLHTMLLVPSFVNSILESFTVLWRYGYDLLRMKRAVTQATQKFDMIYVALNDTEHDSTYFNSPMDIWRMMGLDVLITVSYHDLLDGLGLYRDSTLELISNNHTAINGGSTNGSPSSTSSNNMNHYWDWRKWIPGMGCLRSELLSGVSINTYNQGKYYYGRHSNFQQTSIVFVNRNCFICWPRFESNEWFGRSSLLCTGG
jgi:prenylcysteine oxidase/farnesylcysteine lyase